ncbi:hypothetical protein L7F22_052575 [Adiantum nelumboides]|nr:hypothetical protein [Adiantum nelumboides]
MHVDELKDTIDRLSLTLQTLQVVVEENAPLDAMASALKERDFIQEVEECAQARMDFVRSILVKRSTVLLSAPPPKVPPVEADPSTKVKFVGVNKCGDQDSKVLGHAEKEDVLDKDAEVEIVGGYNCEEQDSSVEVHIEKEDGAAKKPIEDAEGKTKTSKDQVEKETGENSNMESRRKGDDTEIIIKKSEPPQETGDASVEVGGDASCACGAIDAGGAGEDMEIIIEIFEPPQEKGDALVNASMDASEDAICASGAGGAGEDTAEPPQENGDPSVDVGGDASCAGGAIGASVAEYVRHNDATVPHPWEDGGDARGVAGYVRNNDGTVSCPWEDPRNILFKSKPAIIFDINGVLLTSIDKRKGENASNFLDYLEMAFLISGRDSAKIKLRAFPLVLREEAKVWFQGLDEGRQGDWEVLKRAFLQRLHDDNNSEEIWRKLSQLQQASPDAYPAYEARFLKLWTQWEQILPEGERAPNFLQKERLKDRKLQFQRSMLDQSQAAAAGTTSQEEAPPPPPNESGDPHLDLLQRVTNQLDNLSINLIHGLQPQQPAQPQAQGQGPNGQAQRRPPRRDIHYYNCNEDGHGMYFCPYPKRYGNVPPRGPRQQISPPRMRQPPMPMPIHVQQQQQPPPSVYILRQQPTPQPTAEAPPLLEARVERAVNVIRWKDKGNEKEKEAEVMPVKKARVTEEPSHAMSEDGAKKEDRKRKKRASVRRRKIGITDFPLGVKSEA